MNIPLRAACDQSDLLREPGDAIADFAQRDLFEYFAPPLTEAGSPPLAADHLPPAASPNEVTAVGDEDVAWHDIAPARGDTGRRDFASRTAIAGRTR
jgi:hypothetical protein